MFIVLLTYKKPLTEVDRLVPAHRKFLEEHYAAGHFVLSGRKEPRTGGIIIANAASRAVLDQIIQCDPFYQAGVADYECIEFIPGMASPELAGLIPI